MRSTRRKTLPLLMLAGGTALVATRSTHLFDTASPTGPSAGAQGAATDLTEHAREAAIPLPAAPEGVSPLALPGTTAEITVSLPVEVIEADDPLESLEALDAAEAAQDGPGALGGTRTASEGGSAVSGAPSASRSGSTGSGTGTLVLKTRRSAASEAPGMPTYASLNCDGNRTYAGGVNTTRTHGVATRNIPFSGKNCRLILRFDYSSTRWSGSQTFGEYSLDVRDRTEYRPTKTVTGRWTSHLADPRTTAGFDGLDGYGGQVTMHLTNCFTRGGATDRTASNMCDGRVQRNVDSDVRVRLFNDQGSLGSETFTLSYWTHHDSRHYELSRAVSGRLRVEVTTLSGPPVIIHAPNSVAVGTR